MRDIPRDYIVGRLPKWVWRFTAEVICVQGFYLIVV
jgi:hypothetical protein